MTIAPKPLHHMLVVCAEPSDLKDALEDDAKLVLGAGRIDGEVLVRVNGSPVFLQLGGFRICTIDALLQNGDNVVTFEGRHTKPMFAKIIRTSDVKRFFDSYYHEKVLGKTLLPIDHSTATLRFRTEVPSDALPDLLVSSENPPTRVEQDIRDHMNALYQTLYTHDAERYLKLIAPDLEKRPWWGIISEEDYHRLPKGLSDAIQDRRLRIVTKPADVKLIVGTRSVLAYSRATLSGTPAFHLAEDDSKRTYDIDGFLWVRVNGKWLSY